MIGQDFNNWELAEAYVANKLSASELANLHKRLSSETDFASDFNECVSMLLSLDQSKKQRQFRNMLVHIHHENETNASNWRVRTIPLRTHYLRTGAIAAGIAILTTISTFSIISHNEKKRSSQYSLLRRELETIKRSQSALIKNINETATTPVTPANYSGTGVALSNDGYFVTNYHVVAGADSIYIQRKDGHYYKAVLSTFDEKSDVAIIKVEDKNFKIGKGELPYRFATTKNPLGSKVFTLGYPQDEIVYNEGYISAKNGYLGDSLQYRLELPASPGQSGAPVTDNNGNIIALVTGKESESEGTTYAVGAKAIVKLISNSDLSLRLPQSNKLGKMSREQQIQSMEQYTCSVKVYKK
ncbi:MAG: trypsin-like peptidase domain-containing protein [Bacteroidetes bacterium]|nr:trypsin-like peptidase domain-containing protein [Bacteroidota bacterium]MBS1739512.1 trypsin-like peptidase domain-containing protein [Bacteroidota bacterium]MBS1777413.1 trypsin-like peptidase domain-containing protein [Bacteroidota bacterium]